MRKRDLHILTTSIYTYTGDQRFEVLHNSESDDWDLRIAFAQTRDTGIYECQVNTEPKINLAVQLDVTGERNIGHTKFRARNCSVFCGVCRLFDAGKICVAI